MEVSAQVHASTALLLGKSPRCSLYMSLGGPQSLSGQRGEEKNSVLPAIEYAPSIPVAIPTELSRLFYIEHGGKHQPGCMMLYSRRQYIFEISFCLEHLLLYAATCRTSQMDETGRQTLLATAHASYLRSVHLENRLKPSTCKFVCDCALSVCLSVCLSVWRLQNSPRDSLHRFVRSHCS
jgi:hypothetical protein